LLGAAALGLAVHLLAAIDAAQSATSASASRSARLGAGPRLPTAGTTTGATAAGTCTAGWPLASARSTSGSRTLIHLATELLTLIGARPVLAVLLAGGVVAVGHSLAMIDLVLPAAAIANVVAIEVAVDVVARLALTFT